MKFLTHEEKQIICIIYLHFIYIHILHLTFKIKYLILIVKI